MDTEEIDDAVEQVRLELITRQLMVMLVGLIGTWVGIAIVLTGAPDFIEQWFSPWSRYGLGGVPLLAGLAIVFGGLRGDETYCGWMAETLGLGATAVWNTFMGAAYGVLVIRQGLDFVGPGEPLSLAVTGRGYVPLMYLGLTMMALVPLVAMIRIERLRRRERRAGR